MEKKFLNFFECHGPSSPFHPLSSSLPSLYALNPIVAPIVAAKPLIRKIHALQMGKTKAQKWKGLPDPTQNATIVRQLRQQEESFSVRNSKNSDLFFVDKTGIAGRFILDHHTRSCARDSLHVCARGWRHTNARFCRCCIRLQAKQMQPSLGRSAAAKPQPMATRRLRMLLPPRLHLRAV